MWTFLYLEMCSLYYSKDLIIQDMDDFAKVNEVYTQYFKEDPPCRSCVAVKQLPKNAKFEI